MITVDLEHDWGSKKTDNIRTQLPRLLDFFDEHQIRATFFVVGELERNFRELIKSIGKKHEIGSHSYSHPVLRKLNPVQIDREVGLSKMVLEDLGLKVCGFRSPECLFPKDLGGFLKRHGYVYDSSVACSLFPGRYNNLLTKPEPYVADGKNLKKKGSDVIELPIPGFGLFRLPFGFPFVRLLYPISLMGAANKYIFYMHPAEFLESAPGKGDNFFVRKLYGRNRGEKAWEVLEKLVAKIEHNKPEFVTCNEFVKSRFQGLP